MRHFPIGTLHDYTIHTVAKFPKLSLVHFSIVTKDYSLILILSLCNIKKTAIRQAIYNTSIITLRVAPVFSVSTKKLTRPVNILAKRKNPS